MSSAETRIADARRGITRKLAKVGNALLRRQALRSLFAALTWSACGMLTALLLLSFLPWLLMGAAPAAAPLISATVALACAIAGAWVSLRGYRPPNEPECALTVEARAEKPVFALSTMVGLRDDDPFAAPLLRCATAELAEAARRPGPHLLRTSRLICGPLLVLAAGVAFVGAMAAPDPAGNAPAAPASERPVAASLDLGASRSEADMRALERAMGLREGATRLERAAATIRDSGTRDEEKQAALDSARRELRRAGSGAGSGDGAPLPTDLPRGTAAREELAASIEAAAGTLRTRAIAAGTRAGTVDTGGDARADPRADGVAREAGFVAFAAAPPEKRVEAAAKSLAMQSPARRALAQRAERAMSKEG